MVGGAGEDAAIVTVGAEIPPPREGLPPCMETVVFEGRCVLLHRRCDSKGGILVRTARFSRWDEDKIDHPGYLCPKAAGPMVSHLNTDDPAAAQAAFDKGAEWVRTGETGEKAS